MISYSFLRQFLKAPLALGLAASAVLLLAGCKAKEQGDGAPPANQPVIQVADMNLISIDKDDVAKFPLTSVGQIETASDLTATGSVFPDINREVPVISMANGRVVDIKTRLDDNVKKGQLLIKVQSPDITSAFDTYLKAANDEQLANKAFVRAGDLFKHGAISQAMLEQAEDTEKDAKADLTAAEEQLRTLGVDKNHPSSVVSVFAPISGVIVAQNVTNAAAAGVNLSGSATAFTIADLSVVWIVCDVYENDLPTVHVGDPTEIALNAYPGQVFKGRVDNILPILDPNIRTGKVRIEVRNPGFMKVGMFVTATFRGQKEEVNTSVPASAILHLHDRDWVYVPTPDKRFRRVGVVGGDAMPGGMQEIKSGLQAGQQVVTNPLALQNEIDNK